MVQHNFLNNKQNVSLRTQATNLLELLLGIKNCKLGNCVVSHFFIANWNKAAILNNNLIINIYFAVFKVVLVIYNIYCYIFNSFHNVFRPPKKLFSVYFFTPFRWWLSCLWIFQQISKWINDQNPHNQPCPKRVDPAVLQETSKERARNLELFC